MLYLNDIIEMLDTESRYRIVHLDFNKNACWLYPLFGNNPRPVFSNITKLEHLTKSEKAVVLEATGQAPATKASAAAIRERDAAFESIQPLIATEDIFFPSDRNRLINARALELNCSPRTLMRALRLYWAGGQTRNALLPKYHARGSTNGATSNRGRPPKYMDCGIYQVQQEDLQTFKWAIETFYLKGVTATVTGTYNEMLLQRYSVIDSEGERLPRAPGEFPTIDQFRRYFKSKYPQETVVRNREGDAEFNLNHAPKLGDAELSVFTVGDNFEIDATIADVLLVSMEDRSVIVGKPTLYLIIDSKSWFIAGFYVGFENPCWPAALHAIVSIAEDKRALCARYGVTYRPEDWPAHGILPKQFTADRGELLSKDSTAIADGLESTVKNLPSKMANRKPHVECGFKLIQRPMAEHVPGYEPPENFRKRQGKRYDKDASLNLDEFTNIVLNAIIRFNNTARDDYPLTPAQTLSGLIPTPRNLWNHEIRSRAGALRRYSAEYLRMALLPRDTATVSREGIQFHGCFYSCDQAIERGWFVRSSGGSFKVTISHDRRLVDTIYIHDNANPGCYFAATLLEKSAHFRGMSLHEVDSIRYERERTRRVGRYQSLTSTFQFRNAVDPITSEAKAETKLQTKGKSRSSRKADIRENRAEELARERQEKAAPMPSPEAQPSAEIVSLRPVTPNNTTTPTRAARNAKLLEMLNGK